MTYKQLLKAGKYDYEYITPNFDLDKKVKVSSSKLIPTHLEKTITTQEVFNSYKNLATIAEVFNYGAKHPDEQLNNPIFSIEKINGQFFCAVLHRDDGGRLVYVRQGHPGDEWDGSCRVLVRESGSLKLEPLDKNLVLGHLEKISKLVNEIKEELE